MVAGAEPVIVETTTADGFLMTAEQLRAALTPRSRLLIMCTPSNPSGAVYPRWAPCTMEVLGFQGVCLGYSRFEHA